MNATPQTKNQQAIVIDVQQQEDLPTILIHERVFNGKDEARLVSVNLSQA